MTSPKCKHWSIWGKIAEKLEVSVNILPDDGHKKRKYVLK
jgi:hypothetical protein